MLQVGCYKGWFDTRGIPRNSSRIFPALVRTQAFLVNRVLLYSVRFQTSVIGMADSKSQDYFNRLLGTISGFPYLANKSFSASAIKSCRVVFCSTASIFSRSLTSLG